MDKRVKWGIIILVGAGLIGLGIHIFFYTAICYCGGI